MSEDTKTLEAGIRNARAGIFRTRDCYPNYQNITAGFISDVVSLAKVVNANDPIQIEKAALVLKSGRLVAFPTETVYGLGASIFSEVGIQKIFTAKGINFFIRGIRCSYSSKLSFILHKFVQDKIKFQ